MPAKKNVTDTSASKKQSAKKAVVKNEKISSSDVQKRRPRTSREVGRKRFIDAALQLLHEVPFSQVSVRDISRVADMNQGLIHTWFGSQHQLYLSAIEQLVDEKLLDFIAQPLPSSTEYLFTPDVRFAIRLAMWLDLEGTDVSSIFQKVSLLLEVFAKRLSSEGIDAETSRYMAHQAAGMVLGIGSFGHLLGFGESLKLEKFVDVWRRQARLMGENDG